MGFPASSPPPIPESSAGAVKKGGGLSSSRDKPRPSKPNKNPGPIGSEEELLSARHLLLVAPSCRLPVPARCHPLLLGWKSPRGEGRALLPALPHTALLRLLTGLSDAETPNDLPKAVLVGLLQVLGSPGGAGWKPEMGISFLGSQDRAVTALMKPLGCD